MHQYNELIIVTICWWYGKSWFSLYSIDTLVLEVTNCPGDVVEKLS